MRFRSEDRDIIMKIENPHKIPIVDSFLRLYGKTISRKFENEIFNVEIFPLPDSDNDYSDIMVRLGKKIFISQTQIGKLGLTPPEIYAALAHELGHILYRTHPWAADAENRADSLAAELGLGPQMIRVIEKIILSRRYPHITSLLVRRIQFLQHLA